MKVFEPLRVGGLDIEELDVRAMSGEDIVRLNMLGNILRAESNPEDPPRPVELTRASVENLPDFFKLRLFAGREPDGTWAALGQVAWSLTEENEHLVSVGIQVLPERRRRGVAKTLLGIALEVTEAENRTTMSSGTSERVPAGEAFARRVGAQPALAGHTNRLLLKDVDRDLVRRWVDEGPQRAPGYSLVTVDGVYPDDLAEAIVDVVNVMNTAPRDDLDMEDETYTVDQARQFEKGMVAAGTERWSLFARHDETGVLAGFTEVSWNPNQANTVWQQGTAVRPEHRGRALGKWLKAVMLERVLDERPEIDEVRTGNADSNDAMLGINSQLGFKPYIAETAWQVTVDRVREYLAG